MKFFVGLHHPHAAQHVGHPCCISVNVLRRRRGPFAVDEWIMDSGAFTEITQHGGYRHGVADYAAEIRRWAGNGQLLTAAAQDWMCEPRVIAKTGLSIAEHQRLTVERYDALVDQDTAGISVLPVLQGYMPDDYRRHIELYGERLTLGQWVGVGSVCKRNAAAGEVRAVLGAIKRDRPDLRLHGFGLKLTTLLDGRCRSLLHSADSMAWSYDARRTGKGANDWRNAIAFIGRVTRWAHAPLPLLDRGGSVVVARAA